MRRFQLRTYRLRSPEAATAYLPHWNKHIHSLRQFGVETHAFFSAPAEPTTVTALVSMDETLDPEAVTREYLQSEALKRDMEGFDVAQIEGVTTLYLVPGVGSPLA